MLGKGGGWLGEIMMYEIMKRINQYPLFKRWRTDKKNKKGINESFFFFFLLNFWNLEIETIIDIVIKKNLCVIALSVKNKACASVGRW